MSELKFYDPVDFEINWENIKSVDDVKLILKGLNINVRINKNSFDEYSELIDKKIIQEKS